MGPEKNLAERDGNGGLHALWKVQNPSSPIPSDRNMKPGFFVLKIHPSPPNPEPQIGSNGLKLSDYSGIRENGMEGMERREELIWAQSNKLKLKRL